MPFILGALAVLGAAYFWMVRMRDAKDITYEMLDVANDVRLAARRFGFQRRNNLHPVEAVEDPLVAAAALVVGFLELEDYPTSEQKTAMISALRENLHVSHEDAEELAVLGRWLVGECGGANPAMSRLARRLFKLSGQEHFTAVAKSLQMIAKFGTGSLSGKQQEALTDVSRIMKMA